MEKKGRVVQRRVGQRKAKNFRKKRGSASGRQDSAAHGTAERGEARQLRIDGIEEFPNKSPAELIDCEHAAVSAVFDHSS